MSDKKLLITASLWVVGAFGLSQIIRLVGNLVVTRLLEPEMFGIMAIAFVVMHGLAMFSDLGLWAFIVRHKTGTDQRVLDTVWSMQLVRGWIMFIVLVFSVLFFSMLKSYSNIEFSGVYGQEVLPLIIIIVGFTAVINGYKTMAPAILSRELKRGRLELIDLASQFFGVAAMLIWAWFSPSIWSLVSAGIFTSVISVTLTYKIFSHRNKFVWDKKIVNEVFHFGKWIFIASVLTYIAQQGDRLFFGATISAAQLGIYSIAFMLASTVINIAQQLTSKILFPAFSKAVNDNHRRLKTVYYKARVKLDFAVYMSAGMLYVIAPTLINILYDERYINAGWMLQILTILIVGTSITSVAQESLTALGLTKVRMQVMLIRSLGLLVGLPLLFNLYGFEGAIWAVALNPWLGLPMIYWKQHNNDLLSWIGEIKMIPTLIIGYFLGLALINL
ncbi:MAG: hypothetical protein COB23_09610 [Methylophaga sp.]|nr:MAG: hypothetical protein COB23_09610 [Methylophaga sp.]